MMRHAKDHSSGISYFVQALNSIAKTITIFKLFYTQKKGTKAVTEVVPF